MTAAAIIAEYNPFHNGHAWQITRAKKMADYVIVMMSPDFVQRGEPAIVSKYVRAKMALYSGADLVLELPASFATGSAEYFAWGGVHLLDRLGCIDKLIFGCENASPADLASIANVLSHEPLSYRQSLQKSLRSGCSFPAAREKAVAGILGQETARLLETPNNILAIEYMKALTIEKSAIEPVPLQRQGGKSASHHSLNLGGIQSDAANSFAGNPDQSVEAGCESSDGSKPDASASPESITYYASASALRKHILSGGNLHDLAPYMPESALSLLSDSISREGLINPARFDAMLYYVLWEHCRNNVQFNKGRNSSPDEFSLTDYLDVSPSLSNKIIRRFPEYRNFESFSDLLGGRDVTKVRVKRALLHILLGIRKDETERRRKFDNFGYARILGFRKEAQPLLHRIKETSSIPLISKPASALKDLEGENRKSFREDLYASELYRKMHEPAAGYAEIASSPIVISSK